MLPPYTGYAHGHHSGELSISVRTHPHTHLHARAHTHTCACTLARAHTHPHIHMHARTLLPCAVEPLPQGLRGPRRHRREKRRTQSQRYTHTHTHTCTQHVQVHTWQLTTREPHKFTCGHELYSQLVILSWAYEGGAGE